MIDIATLNTYVQEAQWAARDWREQAWRSSEMYDGGKAQWTQADYDAAIDAGIDPVTINRTFPAVNLLLGYEAINKYDITAKARTNKDSEVSQIMTESIKFIMDQCTGTYLISQVFKDQIIPGFGCLSPSLNRDPRKEKLTLKYRDWKEMWWDPFSMPWWNPESTKYVFQQRWMDLTSLQAEFKEKENELQDKFNELSGAQSDTYSSFFNDEASLIEENTRQMAGSGWVESKRKRVRPVEMWYPRDEQRMFASFLDGTVIELDDLELEEQFQIVQQAQEVVVAVVKKMYVCTFIDNLVLMHQPSPFPHDEYPFVPFLGYIDRFKTPYGVPKQIMGQDEEVNKRRSMALAFLKSRRVTVEEGVAKDKEGLQRVYEEANKLDGFVVVKKGMIDKIKIHEQAELAPSQISILQQDEREIQEMSGANSESSGFKTPALSGVALEKKITQGATTTATLFDNKRRSLHMIGEQIVANVQGFWKAPKVLRITDRLSGAERFVQLNQKVIGENNVIKFRNNITQGKYDTVISDQPQTDTVREQNMNLVIEWVKKSPPEVIPHLMSMAFEMSNIPNKDMLLAKIKPLLGGDFEDEDLTPEEIKAKTQQQMAAAQKKQQEAEDLQKAGIHLELSQKQLENIELKAKIQKILIDAKIDMEEAKLKGDQFKVDAIARGFEMTQKALEHISKQQGAIAQ